MATDEPRGRVTFAEVQMALIWDGYGLGAPSNEAAVTDGAVCASTACEACGQLGLSYRPLTKGSSYCAFALCGACGHWQEC